MSQANSDNNGTASRENQQEEALMQDLDMSENKESLGDLADLAIVDSTKEAKVILCAEPDLIEADKWDCKFFEIQCFSIEAKISEIETLTPSMDLDGWSLLDDNVKNYIKSSLICLILSNDGNKNLTEQIGHKMQAPALRHYWNSQVTFEEKCGEACFKFLNTFVNVDELNVMIDTIKAESATKAKLAWLKAWTTDSTATLGDQLVVFMVIQSIFVCHIYKLSQHLGDYIDTRLRQLKDFISHIIISNTQKHFFSAERLLDMMIKLLKKKRVTQIITEAVAIERQFLATFLSQADMDDMIKYMEHFVNLILETLHYPAYYNQHDLSDLDDELKNFLTLFSSESNASFQSDFGHTPKIEILGVPFNLRKDAYKCFEERCDRVEDCNSEFQKLLVYSSEDLDGWSLLEDNVKSCIKKLLICFYLSNDGYKDLTELYCHKIEDPVLRRFYIAQLTCETAHGEACLKFLNELVSKDELNVMIDKIKAESATKAKLAWLKACTTDNTVTFADQLVVSMVIKSIFVCSVCKLSQHLGEIKRPRIKVLKLFALLVNMGTKKHYVFAESLLRLMIEPRNRERVTQIITDAISIEKQFLATVLSPADTNDIIMYMEDIADQIFKHLRYPAYYDHDHFQLNQQPLVVKDYDIGSFLILIG